MLKFRDSITQPDICDEPGQPLKLTLVRKPTRPWRKPRRVFSFLEYLWHCCPKTPSFGPSTFKPVNRISIEPKSGYSGAVQRFTHEVKTVVGASV